MPKVIEKEDVEVGKSYTLTRGDKVFKCELKNNSVIDNKPYFLGVVMGKGTKGHLSLDGAIKKKWEITIPVIVYDKFRFAIPVQGELVTRSRSNDGVEIKLTTTNSKKHPIGSTIWVHAKQCEGLS